MYRHRATGGGSEKGVNVEGTQMFTYQQSVVLAATLLIRLEAAIQASVRSFHRPRQFLFAYGMRLPLLLTWL